MPKKRLDVSGITDELAGSAFFPAAPVSPAPVKNHPTPIVQTERMNRTVDPNDRTVEDEYRATLLDDIAHGVKTDRRPTERYSFEIYSDLIPRMEELQYLYKKRTGKKLPASRILREALEAYLQNAFEAMKREK